MHYHRFLLLAVYLYVQIIQAQEKVTGVIYEGSEPDKNVPLSGANIYWEGTQTGTITDFNGAFELPYKNEYRKLIVSYVGYKTDTLSVTEPGFIRHWLLPEGTLDEVVIQNRKQTSFRSYLEAQNVTNVSSAELLKAACCNLAESFETNPSIDVNFPDALTGNRQIKMLGLTSPYTLIAIENIPSIRGASQSYGLSFIPGTWVESIQISKGAGSVINGYESIAGQINAELQKPTTDDAFFVNAYAGNDGRYELNNHLNFKLNEKWYTGLYLHGNLRDAKMDSNDDGFLDMPLAKQFNLMNRWQYMDAQNGFVGFLNIRYLTDQKQIGQVDFNLDTDKFTTNAWGGEINTNRAEASLKLGYVFPEIPYQSIGVQAAYSDHKQESYYGFNVYDIHHKSFYSNVIFSSIIGDSRHNFKTGISFSSDYYDEQVRNTDYLRIENSIGGFFEYSFDNLGNLNLIAGVRLDHHNQIGTFVTPRVHARYTLWDKAALKGSFGRGVRAPSIFAENQQLFSSARTISFVTTAGGRFYGLDAEDAWNYGISFLQGFRIFNRDADITFDFYRTDFVNQIVVDWEDPQQVLFYNLDGSSYANSFQTEINLSPAERVDVRLSYRLFDVQTDYLSGRLQKPLTPKHRFFANAAYETKLSEKGSQWKFDVTYNWLSDQRFPSTLSNPEAFRVSERTPHLNTLNAQITRVFSPKFEIYVGGENITNVRQNNPIVGADDPFGPYFDTSLVYGPIFGSMYYAGLRWKM
tara:strand:- start:448 stop:2694 length:2247 start_codon:yes stop_codon:yes gene_type:complete